MGRPRSDAHDEATVSRLLAAAEAEFGSAGYDRARLEDIARAAGIRRPSLLYHFASKEALYAAVVHRAFEGLGEALEASMTADRPFAERLEESIRGYLGFLRAHPGLGTVVLREMLDGRGPGRDVLVSTIAPLLDRVERFVLEEGKGQVQPGLPVREAILQVVSGALVRLAADALREPLWGPADHTLELARCLFLGRAR